VPESLVGRAQRTITGAVTGAVSGVSGVMGKMAQSVVGTAVDTAVSQVARRSRAPAAKKAGKAPRRR
jgi:hypothetical protein